MRGLVRRQSRFRGSSFRSESTAPAPPINVPLDWLLIAIICMSSGGAAEQLAKMPSKSNTWSRKLGAHHFAYMRAWAEGLPIEDAARRYLGIEHGNEIPALHRAIVDELRALARRGGDSRWRLIGVDIGALERRASSPPTVAGNVARAAPSLDDWAAEQGYDDGWSEEELLAMYAEAFPPAPARASADVRRGRRNGRVRRRQLDILADLERVAVVPANASDPVGAWFEPKLVARLRPAGLETLGALRDAIRTRPRWWNDIRGLGPVKARRIEDSVLRLIPRAGEPQSPRPVVLPHLSFLETFERNEPARTSTDLAALRRWLSHKPLAPLTHEAYARESERFLIWCAVERSKHLLQVTTSDCRAYLAFIDDVPLAWRNRRKHIRHELGWTPFRGTPSSATKHLIRKILGLMFAWLSAEDGHLPSNPWPMDGHQATTPTRQSAGHPVNPTPAAVLAPRFEHSTNGALGDRNHVGLVLLSMLSLRASELHRAVCGDLLEGADESGARALQVRSVRGNVRRVSLDGFAWALLEGHFATRGLPSPALCSPETPLMVAIGTPSTPVTYSAIYKSWGVFLRRQVRESSRARGYRPVELMPGPEARLEIEDNLSRRAGARLSIYKALLRDPV